MQAFCPRIDILKGNCCILRIRGAPEVRKKVFFIKKWSPKLIFLNEYFFEKILLIFDLEN